MKKGALPHIYKREKDHNVVSWTGLCPCLNDVDQVAGFVSAGALWSKTSRRTGGNKSGRWEMVARESGHRKWAEGSCG